MWSVSINCLRKVVALLNQYHANGQTIWSKGKIIDGVADGYWEWYLIEGTIKRSGYFEKGNQVGEWTTYDKEGKPVKVTLM